MQESDSLHEALKVLEVGPDATWAEVTQSYQELKRVWQLDNAGSDDHLQQRAAGKISALEAAMNEARNYYRQSPRGAKYEKPNSRQAPLPNVFAEGAGILLWPLKPFFGIFRFALRHFVLSILFCIAVRYLFFAALPYLFSNICSIVPNACQLTREVQKSRPKIPTRPGQGKHAVPQGNPLDALQDVLQDINKKL